MNCWLRFAVVLFISLGLAVGPIYSGVAIAAGDAPAHGHASSKDNCEDFHAAHAAAMGHGANHCCAAAAIGAFIGPAVDVAILRLLTASPIFVADNSSAASPHYGIFRPPRDDKRLI